MRQIVQSLKTGETTLAEVPAPACKPGTVLIRTHTSVVSVGTERMLIDFGNANLLDKARQQPDKVKEVLAKIRTNGVIPTLEAVQFKLESEMPLGYCNAGEVIEVGAGVPDLEVGDRVISNGPHAEVVRVPHRLTAKIPEGVSYESAVWTVLGSIGLQGIRLAAPTLGESIVVVGLGPIGLLSVQMLRAAGCQVAAIDLNPARCALAEQFGALAIDPSQCDPVEAVMAWTGGRGADAVLLTLATRSDEPVAQAAQMSRKRGRIVLVGVSGLNLSRADFYEKELSLQVSCSYGPGRYDSDYEDRGQDYPAAFVRWTEQRNFDAVLRLLADGGMDPSPLVTHNATLTEAPALYGRIAAGEAVLGALIAYPTAPDEARVRSQTLEARSPKPGAPRKGVFGVLGAGNFAMRQMLPLLDEMDVRLRTVASSGGLTAGAAARKFHIERSTTDVKTLLDDPEIDSLLVATRHDSHAQYVIDGLERGKALYVEKPLAVTEADLDRVQAAYDAAESPLVMVGFNRRYAPLTLKMKDLLRSVSEPKVFLATVNAGAIPAGVWVHDPVAGGGRIIGEGCHFIDLLRFLAGSPIVSWSCTAMPTGGSVEVGEDKASITLGFADGSFGTVHYLANGHSAFPKERIEVFAGEKIARIDNFKSLQTWGWPKSRTGLKLRQDKGHANALKAFVSAVQGDGVAPIPFEELMEISRATIHIGEACRRGGGHGTL